MTTENSPSSLSEFKESKTAQPLRYTPDQNTLLIFSYSLLASNQIEPALETMKLEVQEYPDFWNAYDTLAEIYAAIGEKRLAIENYERSIDLNPDNRNAIENVKKLKAQN